MRKETIGKDYRTGVHRLDKLETEISMMQARNVSTAVVILVCRSLNEGRREKRDIIEIFFLSVCFRCSCMVGQWLQLAILTNVWSSLEGKWSSGDLNWSLVCMCVEWPEHLKTEVVRVQIQRSIKCVTCVRLGYEQMSIGFVSAVDENMSEKRKIIDIVQHRTAH